MKTHARWSVFAVVGLLALLAAAPGAQGPSDYQALRKEMDLLRERLAALQQEVDALKASRLAAPSASTSGAASGVTPVSNVTLNLANAPLRGSAEARVTLVEISDFECPFCGRFFRDAAPQLVKQYIDTGKVQQAFVHLPLSIHRNAFKASEAAACAGDQGKFWQMHDVLFARQSELAPAFLAGKAALLGLDPAAFKACLDGAKHAGAVRADVAMAQKHGISGTPTFLLGTIDPKTRVFTGASRIVGAKPFATFQRALDDLIARAGR